MLKGKRILLGVTGGIAAYKSAFLVRLLIKAGAEVKVVMTPAAHQFITPLTLATLSKNPVATQFTNGENGEWNNHIDLGLWGDLMVIAPASANTLSKLEEGRSDNLLVAVFLSARCPVLVAPAMDLDMYSNKATQINLVRIQQNGVKIIPPGTGELASGLSGEGRMAEPEEILKFIEATFTNASRLSGKKILVTAGPTYEAIDPVRFIGNHSSGKMGFELAEALAERGADVVLVSGPVSLQTKNPRIERKDVVSAQEMFECCMEIFPTCHAAILSAAVADFRPKNVADSKIKKGASGINEISLEETPDILASLGKLKSKKQILAGFALETNNEIANAKTKLESKNLDFIVLNSLKDFGAGFGTDTNKISILTNEGKTINFELKSKSAVANDIADHLVTISPNEA
ncbi:MAG: bifunctional phosphopantothenoylcysteine decarboxylase/phosphopantothenate--cysteine ligase CoaBC [Bacteroidetes bacterium]|nr:bifunctional phosphopantothenoylcysteine decarboxylase/phosphopantothenate--cysteine ligase CoaBC [Bacteroidota bacterium]